MSKNNGGPAFPTSYPHNQQTIEGMTLRDWIVGQALAGGNYPNSPNDTEGIAEWANELANAVLAKRNAESRED